MVQQQRKEQRRVVAILLALASAGGLVVACFGNRWLAASDMTDTSGIGLRSADCIRHAPFQTQGPAGCQTISNGALLDILDKEIEQIKLENRTLPLNQQRAIPRNPWHGFAVVGMLAFITALLGAVGLLVGAVLALMRRRVAMPIMPTTIAVLGLALSIINGCIFVATKPAILELMVVGWSFMVFGGAAVLGLAAVFPLNRQIRPIDEELGAASATMSWGGSRDDLP